MPRPLKGALLNLLFCQFLTRLVKFEKEIAISDEQKFHIQVLFIEGRY